MPRRRKREPLSDEKIKELRRKDKNYNARRRYALKQRILFYIEYEKLCKKYGCYIGSLSGSFIKKQPRDETLYTISSQLDTLKRHLRDD